MTLTEKQLMEQILEKIKQWDNIIIHRHVSPDPDAIGSQVGLGELIKASFPEKTVKYAGDGSESLNFLHTYEPITMSDYEDALVIVTDTANIARIDGEYYKEGADLIKIDHHPKDDSYGSIEWIRTSASSVSEMITDFWQTFKDELTLNNEGARLLYAGIVGDTGRFQYNNTTPQTMRIAADLLSFDFDHTVVLRKLYEMPPAVARLQGYTLEHTKVSPEGVGHLILSQEFLHSLGLEDEHTNAVVSTPGPISGVKCWGIFVEQPDGTYRCRLRSHGPIINTIAREHNGGGHPLASGANAENLEEVQEILNKFRKVAVEWDQA